MKKIVYIIALFVGFSASAQVGIGTVTPNPSSLLDLTSTTKGFLQPRMASAQRTAIGSPAKGLQVFDTDTSSPWYFDGTVWVNGAATAAVTNIYNSDGTLTGTRTVNLNNNTLKFSGANTEFSGGSIFVDASNSNGTSLNYGLRFGGGSGEGIASNRGSGNNQYGLDFYTGFGNKMSITSGGNVGIGTATPVSTLQVAGVITATKIQGPSDQRFKKNIKPIENALDKVMKLGGYTYDWKDASEFPTQSLGKGHDMGVIAQEVEKQFPEAVSTNADGFKAVSYTELVPALIEAIKTQQQMMEGMKASYQEQMNTLKVEIAKLKK